MTFQAGCHCIGIYQYTYHMLLSPSRKRHCTSSREEEGAEAAHLILPVASNNWRDTGNRSRSGSCCFPDQSAWLGACRKERSCVFPLPRAREAQRLSYYSFVGLRGECSSSLPLTQITKLPFIPESQENSSAYMW